MRVSMKENVTFKTKSCTSIYEIYRQKTKVKKTKKNVNETPGGNRVPDESSSDNNHNMPLVTSEKYYKLNRNTSNGSKLHSSSTLFYDLDNIVRHSFTNISVVSIANCLSHFKVSSISPNGFQGKSHAIVQECAMQVQPQLLRPKDSIEINTKKMAKCFLNDPDFSSEIFLRDDDITDFVKDQKSDKLLKRDQNYWSFAKYHTEYTNPSHQDKKSKKKERTRQIEDPCPCQLFSYTCPCTDNKSLTGLKNSKSLTNQNTSTSHIMKEDQKDVKYSKGHKGKKSKPKDDKPTSITCFDEKMESFEKTDQSLLYSDKYRMEYFEKSDQPLVYSEKYELSHSIDNNEEANSKCKSPSKKKRRILCPNCNKKFEISSLIDASESSMKNGDSIYHMNDHAGKSIYTYKTSVQKQSIKVEGKDKCHHNPRCELVPLCQILPTDNVFLNYKSGRKTEASKNSPRVIRITKACRHHPPCTVAPSCQRANILKNNCEYIPPCLHRPRCVNLPLCVPFSRNIPYDNLAKHYEDTENDECHHIPKCKYVPECQQDYNTNLSNQIHVVQLENACGMLSEVHPSYIKSAPMQECFLPCHIPTPGYLSKSEPVRTDKSCQYVCLDCPVSRNIHESISSEAVVFIRDVGCQFRNKYNLPRDSLRSTKSSILFDYENLKFGSVYRNVHTLRCEDKCTNPKGKIEIDTSSMSLTSNLASSHQRKYGDSEPRPSGFDPKPLTSPFVAYATTLNIAAPQKKLTKELKRTKSISNYATYAVRSRVSMTKNKYRKMFNMKRKRKKRGETQQFCYRKTVH